MIQYNFKRGTFTEVRNLTVHKETHFELEEKNKP